MTQVMSGIVKTSLPASAPSASSRQTRPKVALHSGGNIISAKQTLQKKAPLPLIDENVVVRPAPDQRNDSVSDFSSPNSDYMDSAVLTPISDGLPNTSDQITRQWGIPPRPKPGRKPAVDAPPTKRKAQNRAAQRAFRERRAARVGELEEELQQERDGFSKEREQWNAERQHLQQTIGDLGRNMGHLQAATTSEQTRKIELEARVRELEKENGEQKEQIRLWRGNRPSPPILPRPQPSWEQINSTTGLSSSSSRIKVDKTDPFIENFVDHIPKLPAIGSANSQQKFDNDDIEMEMEMEMEMDFTSYGKPSSRAMKEDDVSMNIDPTVPSSGLVLPQEQECGFCSVTGICPCKDSNMSLEPMASSIDSPELKPTKVRIMEPPASASGPASGSNSGPGSCAACQSDPARRAWCQGLAQSATVPPISSARKSSSSAATSDSRSLPAPRGDITCADTYRQLQRSVPDFDSRRDTITPHLKARPARGDEECGTCEGSDCAPMIVDRASLDAAMLLAGIREPSRH